MQTLQQLLSGKLKGARSLKLSCGLTEFPDEVLGLADTLEVLDLSGNHLTHLPDNFGRLKNLKIAFFSNNYFCEFPQVLSRCTHLDIIGFKANTISHIPEGALPPDLRWLILTDNCLTEMPKSVGRCLQLQKVMLAGNRLKQLPDEMAACLKIQLLRISANEFQELPSWLFSLPLLSWLAFAGNPCSASGQVINASDTIPWNELKIEEQLGEGASGVIAKARWESEDAGITYVAVKIFKGEVTSDGLPADEMNACIAAGGHPNLVPILGKISQHPQQKHGLVLKLIPPVFKNLGGPPDFKSCTRDTYSLDAFFFIKDIINISSGIAAAAAQLHRRGIMHGDLYAHNILTDGISNALLGDFGAATFYKINETDKASALERMEVRAFGCLLEDLLVRIAFKDKDHASVQAFVSLKSECMEENVSQRPDFETICQRITSIIKNHESEIYL